MSAAQPGSTPPPAPPQILTAVANTEKFSLTGVLVREPYMVG